MQKSNTPNLALTLVSLAAIASLSVLAWRVSAFNQAREQQRAFAIIPEDRRQVLPDFLLTDTSGHTVRLSDAVKTGPVVLDFWAIWCGPCRAELPDLEHVYTQYGSHGVRFYGINSDAPAPAITEFALENHLALPMLVDSGANVWRTYGINEIPETLVIDRQRRLCAGSIGQDPELVHDLGATLSTLSSGSPNGWLSWLLG